MKILLLAHNLFFLLSLILALVTMTTSFSDFEAFDESEEPRTRTICKFERSAEIQRECSSVLSLASKTKLGNDRIFGISRDLSFQNGDWVQETGGAPLMPFDETDMPKNFSTIGSPLKLASFWVMGFDFAHQTNSKVGLCGVMNIGITRNRTLHYMPQRWSPWFHTSPGYSDQTIVFEGVYVESEDNGGEGLMCLLGSSLFPFSKGFVNFYENSMMSGSCEENRQSSFIKDERTLLLLRYPKNFTLMSRSIIGEMRSLNQKSDPKYFNKVHIFSHLGYDSNYQFVSDQLVSKACNPYPYQDETVDNGVQIFKGSQFCKVVRSFASESFDIAMDSKCNGTRKPSNHFGPFVTDGTNEVIGKYRLLMTSLLCIPGDGVNKLKPAKVSAVFRLVSPVEDHWATGGRTGLSGMTISAEGIWNSSSGQLCMVGCVGLETGSNGCNARICLYFPMVFSVTQRSILTGTISSIMKTDSYTPLLFKKELRPLDIWNRYNEYSKSYLSYRYSKIELANALLKRNKRFDLLGVSVKKLFKYLAVEDSNNKTGLSLLSNALSFSVNALPNPSLKTPSSKTRIGIEILSLGPLFGRYWPQLEKNSCKGKDDTFHSNSSSTENTLPLNISAQLSLTGELYSHILELFLEGIYEPFEGKMYLIGCRKVQEIENFGYEKLNLESNMDCLIEVKVEYSSKTARWLMNPNAKVSIASQRKKEDPLFFSPISLTTVLIPYKDNSREIIFRQSFEAGFRILMLLASIACVFGQLFYVNNKVDVIPFISLAMLGIQILGYVLPLITNAAILFKWKEYQYPESQIPRSGKNTQFQILEYSMKFLVMVAFVLTLRLYQGVMKSRGFAHKPKSLKHKPSEKRVFLSTLLIHILGSMVILIGRNTKAEWTSEVDKYMGVVQDLFLLPQVIGNMLWQIEIKPLSKVYYIGFTVLRLLIRGYDCIREPIFSVYYHKYDSNTSSEFFSKYEGTVIMVIVTVLAIIVHAQQTKRI